MTIAIVTDSTADLPSKIVAQNDISVIPAVIIIEGISYIDGQDISRTTFYEELPRMETPPTTASPSVGMFQEKYDELLANGADQIVSIHVANSLSGIYNSARIAAEMYKGRVNVIDSSQISMGLGFQVIAAAEMVKANQPIDLVIKSVNETQQRSRVIAMLDTMEYLRRSGRISTLTANMGNVLQLRLFLEVKNGSVFQLGKCRTRRKALKKLGEVLKSLGKIRKLAILHSNAKAEAQTFLLDYKPEFLDSASVINVTSVIGTHVGPRAIGFAAVI